VQGEKYDSVVQHIFNQINDCEKRVSRMNGKGRSGVDLIKQKNGTRRRARDGEVIYTCGGEEFSWIEGAVPYIATVFLLK